jgi:hypothetical protein
VETYDGDDLLLDQRREGDEFEKEGEVELLCADGLAKMFLVSRGEGVFAYGGDEEGEGDGLLSAGHCCGFAVEA